MADNCNTVSQCGQDSSTLSIHTRKITDSCRDKDCIEGLRVYLTKGSQAILDTAACTKVRCAELIYTYIDVEPVAFDRNHYCVNVTYYYRVLADATVGVGRSEEDGAAALALWERQIKINQNKLSGGKHEH